MIRGSIGQLTGQEMKNPAGKTCLSFPAIHGVCFPGLSVGSGAQHPEGALSTPIAHSYAHKQDHSCHLDKFSLEAFFSLIQQIDAETLGVCLAPG